MIRRVLIGIGGTPFAKVAIKRAVELCRQHEAELIAVTVLDEKRLRRVGPVPIGGADAAAHLREHRLEITAEMEENTLELLQVECDSANVQLTVHREEGDPFALMARYSRYCDVSVFGLRSMYEYDVMGDTDISPGEVLRRLAVGGVRPIIATSSQYKPIARVLIAYGGSVHAAEAMKQFLRLQPWPDATLRILTCEKNEQHAQQLLDDAIEFCSHYGFEAEGNCRPGAPKKEILLEAADWNADMIVLGATTQNAFTRAIFGSTALHIMEESDWPLFLGF